MKEALSESRYEYNENLKKRNHILNSRRNFKEQAMKYKERGREGKMSKKIIVFAPHPDDETLGCGGTIAKRISEGYEVLIVVMTDGKYAFSKVLGINSDPSPEELKQIRREEMKRAAKSLGVLERNVIFLDFEDGKLGENSKEAEEEATQILKENRPAEAYFPYEKDDHIDHRETNRIIKNSIKKLGLPILKYQYSIYQRYLRVGPIVDKLLNLFKRNMVQVDISEFLSLKEVAVKEFKSEITIISSKQERPILTEIKSFLKNKETFYIER